jgi:cysteine desulfurase
MLPAARAAMAEALERWHNPSSPHAEGRAAKAALEDARERIKRALGWSGELIFTSGATEAAVLAFRRCWHEGPKPILSAVEHDAVRRQIPAEERINVGVTPGGVVDPEQLGTWLRIAPGGLVAIQHVNSETGVIQPIDDIVEVVDAAGSFIFVDCAQSAGKLPLPRADMVALSAHKLGGPPGIGALLVRDLKLLVAEGGQERGYRPGTENLPAIIAFAAALEARPVGLEADYLERQLANRFLLESGLAEQGAVTVCDDSFRSPFVGSYHMPGMRALAQLIRLDALGIAVSAGSACASGTMKPSHVMDALGLDPDFAGNVIRVSFGKDTTEAEVTRFIEAWSDLAGEARRRAA